MLRHGSLSMKTLFSALLGAVGVLVGALFFVTTLELSTASRRADAENRRYESFRLAESMRQSSNDLTRMVQLYVATGDSRYRDYYNQILAIRNGESPRPRRYDSSFWDRVLARGLRGVEYGRPKSLVQLMREARFTREEFRALRSALRASDRLAELEVAVMRVVARRVAAGVDAGYFADVRPQYRRLVDGGYRRQKGRIMGEVERFIGLVDRRTAAEVESLRDRNRQLLIAQVAILALIVLLVAGGLLLVARTVLRPLGQLVGATRRIADGDYEHRAEVRAVAELEQLAGDFNAMSAAIEQDIERREEARRAAERAEREEADFLANMSHEIRTPMNAVIGMTTLLSGTRLSSEQEQYVDVVRSSGEHMLAIVNDVLDYSKIEAGAIELERAPFELHRAAEEALALVAGEAARKGLALDYVEEGELPEIVIGDLARLRQVLINLLSNAVKFTEHGSVTLSVSHEEPDRVRFCVRDTGAGIAAERLPRLFQRYAQADVATTRTHGGTGLGLVISQGLVELMGGSISVASEPAEGSTFTFSVEAPPGELPPAERSEPPPGTLAGFAALVVSPRPADARLLERLLTRWGMEVRACSGEAQALEAVTAGGTVDVALLDDGAGDPSALAQTLRERAPRLPLVLMSSVSKLTGMEGFRTVLLRPLRRQALSRTLVELLAPDRLQEREAGLDATLGARHPLRVLIAEDSSANQLMLRSMLERLGYHPDVVGDGAEAIEAVLRQRYDLVLMDNRMPRVDGISATREILSRLPPERRPAIVGIGAGTAEHDRVAAAQAGMSGRIPKPVAPDRLVEMLRGIRPLADDAAPARPGPRVGTTVATDRSALEGRIAGLDDERFERVAEAFLAEGRAALEGMADAARRDDGVALARVAHRFMGSALLFEAGPLSEHLRRMEKVGETGDGDFRDMVEGARALFASVERELSERLRRR